MCAITLGERHATAPLLMCVFPLLILKRAVQYFTNVSSFSTFSLNKKSKNQQRNTPRRRHASAVLMRSSAAGELRTLEGGVHKSAAFFHVK